MHRNMTPFPAKRLMLTKILFKTIPSFTFGNTCTPSVVVLDVESNYKELFSTEAPNQLKEYKQEEMVAILDVNVEVQGDILLRFYHQPSPSVRSLTTTLCMFRTAFHTSFVQNHHLDLSLQSLDSPSQGQLKDKR